MSKLLNIAIKAAKRKPMQLLETAIITRQYGVNRDFRGKPGKRQVTVLDLVSWNEACNILEKNLGWETRRANLLIENLNFNETTGQLIVIGEAVLEITQETDPCARMDEAQPGLFNALAKNWRGGVCCQVIEDGEVKVGDEVKLISRNEYESR